MLVFRSLPDRRMVPSSIVCMRPRLVIVSFPSKEMMLWSWCWEMFLSSLCWPSIARRSGASGAAGRLSVPVGM